MIQNIYPLFTWLKRALLLAILLLVGYDLYDRFLKAYVTGDHQITAFLVLWVLIAYILLPNIHRFLTRIYVPDYFIGRVRTVDGLLADPLNLAFNGSKKELKDVFLANGWTMADPITLKSSWRILVAAILKRSYPTAPISPLFLFAKHQEIAFQKEINNNPRARHHVRFWRTPKGWLLPGGTRVDWLGAAVYDRSIGLSLLTGQITHKIAEATDDERDFTWMSLNGSVAVTQLEHCMSAYHGRAGGGDKISTDGTLVVMAKR